MKRFASLLLAFGCVSTAQPIESKSTNESKLESVDTDNSGEWAYLVVRDDRDFTELAPVTGSSHDPKEMPAGALGTPELEREQPVVDKMKIKKCNTDADCPKHACLRPTGGPHPYGVCGEAVDHMGRPSPNRVVHSCGIHLACPGSAKCVLAYEDYGMCFK